jgi:hypothetical protein
MAVVLLGFSACRETPAAPANLVVTLSDDLAGREPILPSGRRTSDVRPD